MTQSGVGSTPLHVSYAVRGQPSFRHSVLMTLTEPGPKRGDPNSQLHLAILVLIQYSSSASSHIQISSLFFPPCAVSGNYFAWVYTPKTIKADKLRTVPLIS